MDESTLDSLGWDNWFEEQLENLLDQGQSVARVVTVDRDQLLLLDEKGSCRAKLSGKYLRDSGTASQRPCVGDWVCIETTEPGQFALVHKIFERRTCLRRKAAGDSVEYQMIAANVDFVIIVQSCHFDFNLKRLERYLVMVKDGGATPVILLTKTDLVNPLALADQIEKIRNTGITEPVVTCLLYTSPSPRDS